MRGTELLRLVWLNINQNKFKAIMTSIGIVVGTATIMLVFGIGLGGRMDIAEQFAELNAGEINITYEYAGEDNSPANGKSVNLGMNSNSGRNGESRRNLQRSGSSQSAGERPEFEQQAGERGNFAQPSEEQRNYAQPPEEQGDRTQPFGDRPDFTQMEKEQATDSVKESEAETEGNLVEDRINQDKVVFSQADVDDVNYFVQGITGTTISYTTKASVEGGELTSAQSFNIAGVLDTFEGVSRLEMEEGYFLTEKQNEVCAKVCVLGNEAAKTIFGDTKKALNELIYIGDRTYTVCGVLKNSGTVSGGISLDSSVFVPYETGVKYITGDTISTKLTVVAANVDTLQDVIAGIRGVLASHYENVDFTFEDAGAKMKSALSSNRILTMLLSVMAVIVFIVGGIGIMNVLFVSVKERTNEIGILKAIGTSRRTILLEFLLESAVISLIGGFLGVGISMGITPVLQYFQVRVEMTGVFILISLGFAVLTGTIFGFYPAWKASHLEPVDALNAE